MPGQDDAFRWIIGDAACLMNEAVKVFEDGEAVDLAVAGEFLSCLFTDDFEKVALVAGEDFLV